MIQTKLNYITIGGIKIGLYDSGSIGVGVSGGADSAILLYILMSNIKNHIYIYNMMAEYRRPILEKHFDMVVKTCSELTNNKNYTVRKSYVNPDESAEYYVNMLTDALDKKEVDMIYLGLTEFPPEDLWLTWPGQQPDWHNEFRKDGVEKPLFGFNIPIKNDTDFKVAPLTINGNEKEEISIDERIYIPLFNHNKQHIATLYRVLDVEGALFPVTRSCENDDHPGSHCGKCWWCRERQWGFGYIEYEKKYLNEGN